MENQCEIELRNVRQKNLHAVHSWNLWPSRRIRRRLWDALTRGTSRRRNLTPAILLSADDIDDLGSTNDRWLLDFSGVLYDDALEDSLLNNGRDSDSEERRWRLRNQVWALQR